MEDAYTEIDEETGMSKEEFRRRLGARIRAWIEERGNREDGYKEFLSVPDMSMQKKIDFVMRDVNSTLWQRSFLKQNEDQTSEEQDQIERAEVTAFCTSSNFAQVALALGYDMRSTLDEPFTPAGIEERFTYYFFATHPDIYPCEEGPITEKDKRTARTEFEQFKTFLTQYLDAKAVEPINGETFDQVLDAFLTTRRQEDSQLIKHLFSVVPKNHVIPNNKLANSLTKLPKPDADLALEVSKMGAKKLIETKVILDWTCENKACEEKKVIMSGLRPFTEYDRNVYNAVSSLYVGGHQSHIMTPAIVHRAMTGATNTENPSRQQLEAVADSLEKMCCIRVQIDCTAELKSRRVTVNSKQINRGKITTYLLAADVIDVKAGGETVKAFQIIKPPILYEYAAAFGQVLTLPASMLDIKTLDKDGKPTSRSLANTGQRIVIKGYLLRRIEGMKGDNNLDSHSISLYGYEKNGEDHPGICGIAGKPNANRIETQRIREDVEKMLSYWRAVGHIKGYEAQTTGRKITGYKIDV